MIYWTVFKMPVDNIRDALVDSATGSATNAMGFQISKVVDIAVNGLLNTLLGESTTDKRNEMNAHHDKLLAIVQKTPIVPQKPSMISNPREQIETDVRESNEHIRNAMDELKKAHSLSKCGSCRGTLENTINYVGEATGEILDASEKILAMQRLKDIGELPPDIKWVELNKNQKKLVDGIVQQYHPLKETMSEGEEEGESLNVRKKQTRKPTTKRRQTGRKPAKR